MFCSLHAVTANLNEVDWDSWWILVVIGFGMIRSANLLWQVVFNRRLKADFGQGEGGGRLPPFPARGGLNMADVGVLFFFYCVPD